MGFFFLQEQTVKRGTKQKRNAESLQRIGCAACTLNKAKVHSPKMQPTLADDTLIYFLGEAPGCISGDSLIETAFRDKSKFPNGVPIKDLVGQHGFYVYSYDTISEKIVLGKVNKVWKTGTKRAYRVTYQWTYNPETYTDSIV